MPATIIKAGTALVVFNSEDYISLKKRSSFTSSYKYSVSQAKIALLNNANHIFQSNSKLRKYFNGAPRPFSIMNTKLYPLGDNRGYVTLINVMGSDLSIVNDARVSYDKFSAELSQKDCKLIDYLISHNHTSPLRGSVLKFQVKAPLYIARQWWKHVIASSYIDGQNGWNEKSLRYSQIAIDDYYVPSELPLQDEKNKQGSMPNEVISGILRERLLNEYKRNVERSIDTYNRLLESGVSREVARGVLPSCVYTEFRWTVSLHALLHFLFLRLGSGAQSEIQLYAGALEDLAYDNFPYTMRSYVKHNQNGE